MELKTTTLYFPRLGYAKNIHYIAPQKEIRGIIYFHDGQNLFLDKEAAFGRSWRILDFLKNHPQYGSYAVIGIDNGTFRLTEYSPWETIHKALVKSTVDIDDFGGLGFDYLDDIVDVVVPFFASLFSYSGDNTVLCGSSMGGLISTVAAFRYPNVFPKVASLSSAFWFAQDDLMLYLQEQKKIPVYVYMAVGDLEAHGDIESQMYLDANVCVANYLKDNNVPHTYEVIKGGKHNEETWEKLLPTIFSLLEKE